MNVLTDSTAFVRNGSSRYSAFALPIARSLNSSGLISNPPTTAVYILRLELRHYRDMRSVRLHRNIYPENRLSNPVPIVFFVHP